MDYGKIVSQGWKITWENKYLWVLGFLAALTSSRANSSTSNYTSEVDPESLNPEQLAAIGGAFVAVMCFAMVVGLIIWVISLVAKGSLITAVYKTSTGKEMTLGQALSAGTEKIWTILGMNLLLYLPVFLATMVIIGSMGFMFAGAIGTAITADTLGETTDPAMIESMIAGLGTMFICLMLLCCVMFVVAIFIQFINAFAYRGIMIQNMGVMESISHSWQLLKQNFVEVLILAILFFMIGIGYGMLTGMILFPIALVGMVPMMGGLLSGDFTAINMAYGLGFGVCMGILGAIVMSILVTWQSATFTLAYKEWTRNMGFTYAGDVDDLDDLDGIVEKSPA